MKNESKKCKKISAIRNGNEQKKKNHTLTFHIQEKCNY